MMGDIKINIMPCLHLDEDGDVIDIQVVLHRVQPPYDLALVGPVADLEELIASCAPGEDWESQAATTFGSAYTSLPAALRSRIRQGWQVLRAAARA